MYCSLKKHPLHTLEQCSEQGGLGTVQMAAEMASVLHQSLRSCDPEVWLLLCGCCVILGRTHVAGGPDCEGQRLTLSLRRKASPPTFVCFTQSFTEP